MEKTVELPSGLKVKIRRPGMKLKADARRYGMREGEGDESLAGWYAGIYMVTACAVDPRITLEPEDGALWIDDLSDEDFLELSNAILAVAEPDAVKEDIAPLSETATSS